MTRSGRASLSRPSNKVRFGGLIEPGVMRRDAGHRQQFGQHGLMLVRALPQVDRGQVKAKHLHRPDQRLQPLPDQGLRVLRDQGRFDHAQVAQQFLGCQVGVLRCHRMARGLATAQVLEGGRQARIDADQGAPVRLVLAVLVAVGRALGQGLHLGRELHQHRRQGQLAAQVMHLGQVMPERHVGLAAQSVGQGLGVDVGVAVAVAANPLAHAQKTVHRVRPQRLLQAGIELGDFTQKSGFVIAQRVFHLVGHRQLGKTQQAGVPQLQHPGAQLGLVLAEFARRQGIVRDLVGGRLRQDVVACR